MPSDWTGKMLDYFDKNTDAVVVSGPCAFKDLNFYQIFYWWLFNILTLVNIFIVKTILRKGSVFYAGNFAIKRDTFLSAGGFREDIIFWGDDAEFTKRVFKKGKIIFRFNMKVFTSKRGYYDKDKSFLSNLVAPLKLMFKYGLNYYWVYLFDRPFSKGTKHIR